MLIVDASVGIKWTVREAGTEHALLLLPRLLVAPDLFEAEVADGLTRKVCRGEMDGTQARLGAEAAAGAVTLLPSRPLARAALDLSLALRHSVYDCYYLALAEREAAMLVTADDRLTAKLRGTRWGPLVARLGELLPDD